MKNLLAFFFTCIVLFILGSCRPSCRCEAGTQCQAAFVINTAGDTVDTKQYCGSLKEDAYTAISDSIEAYKNLHQTDSTHVEVKSTSSVDAVVTDLKQSETESYESKGYSCSCSK